MPEFRLPDLGEGLTEAEIVQWLVKVGDEVRVDQPVVEVETAKATVEVPVPFAGVIMAVHGEPGDAVKVGAPLLSVEESGSGSVLVGYGTSTDRRRRTGRRAQRAAQAVESTRAAVISPLVRRMAQDAGVDVARIPGSGPHGIVLRRDVEAATAATQKAATQKAATQKAATQPESQERIPLRGLRKTMAENLVRSRREIPEATVWVDVDATELLAARAAINARVPEQPVSVLALIARFAVLGLRKFRELNSRLDGDEVVLSDVVHLGFAAQTDRGLVVPVVHGAQGMTTRELGTQVARLTEAARNGKVAPSELTGGTFTVNNYGVFGVDGSAAIINYPEVAILGIGRIIDRPWVIDGELTVRKIAELTLAFDHRVCDGAVAGGFLRFVADCVESPLGALAEL